MTLASERLKIRGPAGRIEALLEYRREEQPVATAVVCHPHPQYEGTMENKVAYTLARAAVEAGAAALRFNFRGVGESEGGWGCGRGELADFRAVEQWACEKFSREQTRLPKWRLGFSFGAAIVIAASLQDDCERLVTVAPPLDRFADYGLDTTVRPRARDWLLVQGGGDEVVTPAATLDWGRGFENPPAIAVFDGAGHFFHGHLTALRERVREALAADGERS